MLIYEAPTFTHKGLASMASVSESTTSREQRTGSQVVASLANSAANSPHSFDMFALLYTQDIHMLSIESSITYWYHF